MMFRDVTTVLNERKHFKIVIRSVPETMISDLAVHGDRLYSESRDGTIREWALGAWAALRTLEAYARGERQAPYCLAVIGSKLVSGSGGRGIPAELGHAEAQRCVVRAWDLGTLECTSTLPLEEGRCGA